jgi:hypothetical protein
MKPRLLAAIITIVAVVALQAAGTYATSFPASENPISEGGRWINGKANGVDWSNVTTTPGLAIGTQTGSAGYNDSLAILQGTWGPNQTASATVHSVNQMGGSVFEEVEILLRFSIGSHVARGYEINFRSMNSSESYTQIVRWNGALGSFTEIDGRGGSSYGIREGDTVKATIVGNTITSYINGVAKLSVTDSTFSSGSPGMGFYLQGASGVNGNYGFTSYAATDGGSVPTAPSAPTSLRIVGLMGPFDLWH